MNKKIKFQISGIDQALSGQYIRVEDPSATPRPVLYETNTLTIDINGNVEMDLGDVGEVGLKVIYHCDSHPKDGLSFGYVTGSTNLVEVVNEPGEDSGPYIPEVQPFTKYYNYRTTQSPSAYVRIPPLTVNPGESVSFQIQVDPALANNGDNQFVIGGYYEQGSTEFTGRDNFLLNKRGNLFWELGRWEVMMDGVPLEYAPLYGGNPTPTPTDGLPHVITLTTPVGNSKPNIIDIIGTRYLVKIPIEDAKNFNGTIGFFDSTQTSDSRYYAMDEGYSADGTGAVIDAIGGNNGDYVFLKEENWTTV